MDDLLDLSFDDNVASANKSSQSQSDSGRNSTTSVRNVGPALMGVSLSERGKSSTESMTGYSAIYNGVSKSSQYGSPSSDISTGFPSSPVSSASPPIVKQANRSTTDTAPAGATKSGLKTDSFAELFHMASGKPKNKSDQTLLMQQQTMESEKMEKLGFSNKVQGGKSSDWAAGISFDVLEQTNERFSNKNKLPMGPYTTSFPQANTVLNDSGSSNLLDDEAILGSLAHAAPAMSDQSSLSSTHSDTERGHSAKPYTISNSSSVLSGDLFDPDVAFGKPNDESLKVGPESNKSSSSSLTGTDSHKTINDPRDRYVAELVDMGFSAEHARRALAHTDTGLNLQQAVDYLLKEAHQKARTHKSQLAEQKYQHGDHSKPHERNFRDSSYTEDGYEETEDAWQEMPSVSSDASSNGSSRHGSGFNLSSISSQTATQDLSKLAAGISLQLRSRAEVLWKQGKKTVAKAVDEYNNGGGFNGMMQEESGPRWLRNQRKYAFDMDAQEVQISSQFKDIDPSEDGPDRASTTLEAMMLEQEPPARAKSFSSQFSSSTRGSPVYDDVLPPRPPSRPKSKPTYNDNLPPRPPSRPTPRPPHDGNLWLRPSTHPRPQQSQEQKMTRHDFPLSQSIESSNVPSKQIPKKYVEPVSKKPVREQINIPSIQMDDISDMRAQGTEAFKRGDFTLANKWYTDTLSAIPREHVLRSVILSNRSMCFLKLGNPKDALSDANEGLKIIGPSKGVEEEAEPGKPLINIWIKLLQRKSEALEQLEKFKDARDSWDLLVRSGRGGKVALDGRRRCDNVINPTSKEATNIIREPKPSAPRPAPKPSSIANNAAAQAAVTRLKMANKEAEMNDAEKFALHDSVEEKLSAWRKGKEDNLRALLGSLDTILWKESGWTQVSMADLVIPKKVKITYMKAIAKTHPDKISSLASIEQKMIAQGIFVSLNRAWDDFKKKNGM
ncbi:hypothetical protein V1511DRAFT_497995 [Dipodascopsis uninucleata]